MTIDQPICARPFSLPGDPRQFERDVPFLLRHLELDISLDFERRSVVGAVRLTFVPVVDGAQELRLDAREMRIVSVRGRLGVPLSFSHHDGTLEVLVEAPARAGQVQEIEIAYEAQPRRGLYFVAADQAWTQGEAQDSRYWFPCLDLPGAKATTEVRVSVPQALFALSNGLLVEQKEERGTGRKVYHWRHDVPHPAYLVSLAVGPFVEIVDDADGVQIRYYVTAENVAQAQRGFGRTPQMVKLFGDKLGVPYPYGKYAQVVVDDFIFGGMENTTATTMHKLVLLDERAAIDFTADHIVAHELAHQWFGDLVTCREWSEGWLNEGFATYFETIDIEHHKGCEEAAFYRLGDLRVLAEEDRERYRRALVERTYRDPMDLFDRHLYQKGGAVLHMLRKHLGDSGFFSSLKTYLERHRGGVVETTDLIQAIEDTTGRAVRRFFEQWVYSPGFPDIEATYSWDEATKIAKLSFKQKESFSFNVPLTIQFGRGASRETRVIELAASNEAFAFALPFAPERVVIDPWEDILKRFKFDPGREMLLCQLRDEPEAPARARAAEALGKGHDDREVIRALGESLGKDGFWGVQAAAAAALGEIRTPSAMRELERHRRVAHPKARRAVAKALGSFQNDAAAAALDAMTADEASYFVISEALRSLGRTRAAIAFERLVPALDQSSYEDVIRIGALDGLGELRDERGVAVAMARTTTEHYSPVRCAACRTLGKLAEGKTAVREHLQRLLEEADHRVRAAAVRALGEIGDVRAIGALDRVIERDLEGRVVRVAREVARDLSVGRKAQEELTTLRDSVEKLKQELRDMRDRMVGVEARLGRELGGQPTGVTEGGR